MTSLRIFPGNGPAGLAAAASAALARTPSRENLLHGVPEQFPREERQNDPHSGKNADKIRIHGLNAGSEASFACTRLDNIRWPDSFAVIFSSIRHEYKGACRHEKSMKVARRVLSTSLNPGKHPSCPQEGWALSGCLASWEHCDERNVFFQCYLFMSVITHRYERAAILLSRDRGNSQLLADLKS